MSEYNNPEDRRFHAESIACPKCGPKVFLTDKFGKILYEKNAALRIARRYISEGKIIAVRGIGGFLLVCDAFRQKAIKELRKRKHRPHKPFAVMFRNAETVFKYCKYNRPAEKLLISPYSPIVILQVRNLDSELPLYMLSPDSMTIGAMVPYSPLHYLLFHPLQHDKTPVLEALVMTSGNRSGEPICIKNEEAWERLGEIADFFLCHDREINLRNDDSLCVIQLENTFQIWRRARGFAPEPLLLDEKLLRNTNHTVLAMGAELKNTIALAFENAIFVSPHIGDLETPEAIDSMKRLTEEFPKFLNVTPSLIAVDMHPDMHSSRWGQEIASKLGIGIREVQHHFAHAASCMAEHGLTEALAIVFDGTGLGMDGNIWGAEALYLNLKDGTQHRYATFVPVPLPGGDAAVKHPVRQLVARWFDADITLNEKLIERFSISPLEISTWEIQCKRRINTPSTHAAGRLFDAMSALLGLAPPTITYEGQAAIRLEALTQKSLPSYDLVLPFNEQVEGNFLRIDWAPMFRMVTESILKEKADVSSYAHAFHESVADAAMCMIKFALSCTNTKNIVLTGGVFMNKLLTEKLVNKIRALKLSAFIHQRVPPNDGGISVGQALLINSGHCIT